MKKNEQIKAQAWAIAADEVYPYSVYFSLEQELNCINLRQGFKEGYLSREDEIAQLREALQDCAEVLNLLASRAGIQTEDAALKSDAEDYGALSALRAAREILNQINHPSPHQRESKTNNMKKKLPNIAQVAADNAKCVDSLSEYELGQKFLKEKQEAAQTEQQRVIDEARSKMAEAKGTDWPIEGVAGQHGWVSVDDESKPKRGDVLTYHEANFYNIVWTSGNGKLPLSATHWRYLPEPPKQ